MRVLDRYIIRSIGAAVLIVMMALLTLLALFLFINEQGWVGVGSYGQPQALRYVAFNLPTQLLQFLPVGVLIGSLLAMGGLARHSELTVIRASGVPISRIGASVFLAGLLALPLALVTDEYLAPPLARMARIHKAIQRNGEISLAGPGGAWVREGGLIRAPAAPLAAATTASACSSSAPTTGWWRQAPRRWPRSGPMAAGSCAITPGPPSRTGAYGSARRRCMASRRASRRPSSA